MDKVIRKKCSGIKWSVLISASPIHCVNVALPGRKKSCVLVHFYAKRPGSVFDKRGRVSSGRKAW